jgi:uncharacterized coiled-coil DUF342 family protein
MKNFEEMFNSLIKTMEEKEKAMAQQIQEAKQLEKDIEDMKNNLLLLDAMRDQLKLEISNKENELKQLNKSLGKIDAAKIETKEPEQPKTEIKAQINEPITPQPIEHKQLKQLKKRPRRTIR